MDGNKCEKGRIVASGSVVMLIYECKTKEEESGMKKKSAWNVLLGKKFLIQIPTETNDVKCENPSQ
jgi:hypothetical protein